MRDRGPLIARGMAAAAAMLAVAAPAQATTLPPGARAVGALPGGTPLSLQVVLQPRDPQALQQFADAVSTPGSPLAGQYLGRGEFATRFGPTAATIGRVSERLAAAGLRVGAPSADGLSLPVSGDAAAVQRAFQVGLERVQLAGGTRAYAATGAPALDAAVQTVTGLDDLPLAHPAVARATPPAGAAVACPAASVVSPSNQGAHSNGEAGDAYLTDDRIASAYGTDPLYAAGDLGQGVTIAVFEQERDFPTDITAYEACFGLTTPVSYQQIDGGPPPPTPSDGLESSLDIETLASFAPRASIVVYQTPNNSASALDQYRAIITADKAQVITTSWTACTEQQVLLGAGRSYLQSENTLFQEAAAQGQSLFAAADDNGAQDCTLPLGPAVGPLPLPVPATADPASQPYATTVGGTKLVLDSSNARTSETVWNDGLLSNRGATGGGPAQFWPMPSWQLSTLKARGWLPSGASATTACPTLLAGSPDGYCRELPDVAANADPASGFVIYWNGTWTHVGGTSGGAPLWGGLAALGDECRASNGQGAVGFLSPQLYAAAANPASYGNDFFDITQGNNDILLPSLPLEGFSAGPGYDMASGLGAPSATALVEQLCGGTPRPPSPPPAPAPQAKACTKRLSYRLSQRHGRVTTVGVYVGRRLVRALRGHHLTRVSITAPATRTFTVKLVGRTASRHTVTATHHYANCRAVKAH